MSETLLYFEQVFLEAKDRIKLILILYLCLGYVQGGARGVMVIVVGNGHGDTSSNPWRDWLHFT